MIVGRIFSQNITKISTKAFQNVEIAYVFLHSINGWFTQRFGLKMDFNGIMCEKDFGFIHIMYSGHSIGPLNFFELWLENGIKRVFHFDTHIKKKNRRHNNINNNNNNIHISSISESPSHAIYVTLKLKLKIKTVAISLGVIEFILEKIDQASCAIQFQINHTSNEIWLIFDEKKN